MPVNPGVCSCPGCDKPSLCRFGGQWYCNTHYLRMREHGTTERPQRKRTSMVEIFDDGSAIVTTAKGVQIAIDAADAEKAMRYSWCISKTGYAVANTGSRVIKMHRYLLDILDEPSLVVDHINGNTLDNRRSNLRVCRQDENLRNMKKKVSNTSGYSGIRKTPHGTYNVRITFERKEIHVGNYSTLEEAIEAREQAERTYFGQFAPSMRNNEEE